MPPSTILTLGDEILGRGPRDFGKPAAHFFETGWGTGVLNFPANVFDAFEIKLGGHWVRNSYRISAVTRSCFVKSSGCTGLRTPFS
jgi:hypothetical protein